MCTRACRVKHTGWVVFSPPPLAKRVLGLQGALSVMDSKASPFHLGFVLQTAVESKEQKTRGGMMQRPVLSLIITAGGVCLLSGLIRRTCRTTALENSDQTDL